MSTDIRTPVDPSALAGRSSAPSWIDTAAVCMGALLLFSLTLHDFQAAVTDISARRVMTGAVPYRDFWTMYAPGSIYAMAAAYTLFGVHMLVGKVLGLLVATAAVTAFHRIALQLMTRAWALAAAAVFAAAFFNSGYHEYLGSYPPAILLVLLAMGRVAADAGDPSDRRLVELGLLLGAAALFKHDVAAYACVAAGIALLATGRGLRAVMLVAGCVLVVVLPAVAALLLAGAGRAAWIDLVQYPLGDFKVVRPESFPLVPHIWSGSLEQRARHGIWWATLNLPSIAALAGALGLWLKRSALGLIERRLAVFALVAYPLYWSAGHVQANTHKVTFAALGILLLLAGAPALSRRLRVQRIPWVPALLAAWSAVLLAEPVLAWRGQAPRVPLELPRLAGITVPSPEAQWMKSLAQALVVAAPPDVPLLLLGWRNDVLIHASTQVFWLSDRDIVGGHHELHPAITDTEPVQRELLAAVRARGVLPLVVLEHRFPGASLDHWGAIYRAGGVPVGARLLDEWVAANYESTGRYGMYEVMRPIGGW